LAGRRQLGVTKSGLEVGCGWDLPPAHVVRTEIATAPARAVQMVVRVMVMARRSGARVTTP
jgi:hypothetical protein